MDNSNFPRNPMTGEEGSGVVGEGEGPATALSMESSEKDRAMQAEGGASAESLEVQSQDDSEDAPLLRAQQTKRTA